MEKQQYATLAALSLGITAKNPQRSAGLCSALPMMTIYTEGSIITRLKIISVIKNCEIKI
jgi:hypothetical protein